MFIKNHYFKIYIYAEGPRAGVCSRWTRRAATAPPPAPCPALYLAIRRGTGGPRSTPAMLSAGQQISQCPVCTAKTQYRKFETNFSGKELRGYSPNSYIHVSVSDLYIPLIGLPIIKIGGLNVGIYRSLTEDA
jgi:hypothetical protein